MRPGRRMCSTTLPRRAPHRLPDITVVAAGVRKDSRDVPVLRGPRGHHADIGGITPGRCRRSPPHRRRKACRSTTSSSSRGRALRETDGCSRCWRSKARTLSRNPRRTSPTTRRRSPPTPAACGAAQDGRQFGLRSCAGLHAPRADNAEASVHRVIGACAMALRRYGWTTARGSGRDRVDAAASAAATIDFTSNSAQRDQQLQRADRGVHGRRCCTSSPLVGDRHPAQRGVSANRSVIIPRARADPTSRRPRRRRQRPDLDLHHQRPVRALGVMAAAQCTMNNFTFGERHQYCTRRSRAARAPATWFVPQAPPAASTARASCSAR